MTVGIMQEQQCPAPQDLAGAPDQTAWDQMVGVHGFLVPIEVEGRWQLVWLRRFPREDA
jgi:hypothetical protein